VSDAPWTRQRWCVCAVALPRSNATNLPFAKTLIVWREQRLATVETWSVSTKQTPVSLTTKFKEQGNIRMTLSPGSRPIGYTLSAIADLQTKPGNSPRLRAILFMATNGEDSHTWKASNIGTFVADFAFLVDADEAYKLYQRLCKGEKVTFPGVFDLEILKDRLGG